MLFRSVYEPFLYNPDVVGIEITSAAFESAFSWFPVVLLVASVMFAFSTLVSWAFYGSQAAAYLFGPTKRVDVIFKLTLCFMLSTGAAISLSSLLVGAEAAQRQTGLPVTLMQAVQALIVICVIAGDAIAQRRQRTTPQGAS